MSFENDIKIMYTNIMNRNNYDPINKTTQDMINDFKTHILNDLNTIIVYDPLYSSIFKFNTPISDELVNELQTLGSIEISPHIVVTNNNMLFDFRKLF